MISYSTLVGKNRALFSVFILHIKNNNEDEFNDEIDEY